MSCFPISEDAVPDLLRWAPRPLLPRGQGVFEWFKSARQDRGRSAEEAEPLSPREREVLRLLALGLAAKQVAAQLDLSVKTVDNHRQNAMRKLGLRSRAEVVLYAVRTGLVTP